MTVPRSQLRYIVTGSKELPNGRIENHREAFSNGRDAYIIESWLRRQGYKDVTITIKSWHTAPNLGAFFIFLLRMLKNKV